MKKIGICQTAQMRPRNKLDSKAEKLSCNLSKAYPLHPTSSKKTATRFKLIVRKIKLGSVKKFLIPVKLLSPN